MHLRVSRLRPAPGALAVLGFIAGCGDPNVEREGPPFARYDSAEAGSVVLTRTEAFPCRLEFVDEGVSLSSDLEGTGPDPGLWVSWVPEQDAYLTSVPGGGSIAVWSEDGDFLRTIGRPGEGPGELAVSAVPLVDAEGTVHVLDAFAGRWSRFSFAGDFLGSTTSALLQQVVYSTESALLDPSRLLIGRPAPLGATSSQFRIVGADGSLLREFGEVPSQIGVGRRGRAVAYGGDDSFWAAPRDGDPYVLEEWSLDGRLLRKVRREAAWLPALDDERGLPRYRISAGEGGRLMVLIITRVPEFGSSGPAELRYEVVDPDIPEVLASRDTLIADPSASEVPPWFGITPGASLGFRVTRGDLDLAVLEILRYVLRPSAGEDSGTTAVCGA